MLLIAVLLLVVQTAIGMVVNLYVTVPAHHPGAEPSTYFAGSWHSVVWALGHGSTALSVHAGLGLGAVVFAVGAVIPAIRAPRRSVAVWTVLAAFLIIGAGFNGASFLDFNDNTSSLIMSLLALGAIASYTIALFLTLPPTAASSSKPTAFGGCSPREDPGCVVDLPAGSCYRSVGA